MVYRGCVTRRAAAIFLAVSIAASPARATEPPSARAPKATEDDKKEKSRAAFRKGVAQLRAQEWAAARASFEAAWELYPHPSILLNLGIARLKTDAPVLAERDFLRFLAEDADAAPEELASARESLAEARAKIGTLRVTASPRNARVLVDGEPVQRVASADENVVVEERVKAGPHAIRVEAEGYVPEEHSLVVAAKAETEITVTLTAVEKPVREDPKKTRHTVGWAMVGVSGAALVTAGALALRASSLSDDYGDRSNPSTFQNPDVRSEGIAFRTGADVALGLAVASAGVALVLLLTDLGAARANDAAILRW